MKKLFGISLVALLAVSPMMASAAFTPDNPLHPGDSVEEEAEAGVTATYKPKYSLKQSAATDVKPATAGYVKGAYNAVIKGVNNTWGDVRTFKQDVEVFEDGVDTVKNKYAKRSGLVNGIKAATVVDTDFDGETSLNGISTITATSTSLTGAGTINLAMDVMDDWVTDAVNQSAIESTTSFAGVAVTGAALAVDSEATTGTASITKGQNTTFDLDVDVDEYHDEYHAG